MEWIKITKEEHKELKVKAIILGPIPRPHNYLLVLGQECFLYYSEVFFYNVNNPRDKYYYSYYPHIYVTFNDYAKTYNLWKVI